MLESIKNLLGIKEKKPEEGVSTEGGGFNEPTSDTEATVEKPEENEIGNEMDKEV